MNKVISSVDNKYIGWDVPLGWIPPDTKLYEIMATSSKRYNCSLQYNASTLSQLCYFLVHRIIPTFDTQFLLCLKDLLDIECFESHYTSVIASTIQAQFLRSFNQYHEDEIISDYQCKIPLGLFTGGPSAEFFLNSENTIARTIHFYLSNPFEDKDIIVEDILDLGKSLGLVNQKVCIELDRLIFFGQQYNRLINWAIVNLHDTPLDAFDLIVFDIFVFRSCRTINTT
jgi:hypothetical protein